MFMNWMTWSENIMLYFQYKTLSQSEISGFHGGEGDYLLGFGAVLTHQ